MCMIKINVVIIVAECEENEQDKEGEEEDWLKLSSDCPYFDSISSSTVKNKSNKRKPYYSNKGGNKRFKKGKSKKYA